jgi:peptidoglycan hydrolase-like protein with peptidoglycan-binding domain
MNAPRRLPAKKPAPRSGAKPAATQRPAGRRRPQTPAPHPLAKWIPAAAAVAVLGVVIVAGGAGGSGGGDDNEAAPPVENSEYVISNLTAPDGSAGGVMTDLSTAPIVKTALGQSLAFGASGDEVKAVQARLTALGFAPGVDDGLFGGQTQQAVWAFEKLVMNVPRGQATGTVTNDMWQRMQDPLVITPLRPGNGTHVEIYLPQQVAAVFTDNRATLVIHISSGDGQTWCDTVKLDTNAKGETLDPPVDKAVCGESRTPGGVFKFTRKVVGKRNGPLGGMMNPVYFNYGIAMHGADNVPLEPASHGCIRMHQKISDVFQNFVAIGDLVYVWGQDGRQPEDYSEAETIAPFNYPDPNATTTTSTTTTTTTTIPATSTTVEQTTTTPKATTTTSPATTTTQTTPPTTTVPTATSAP